MTNVTLDGTSMDVSPDLKFAITFQNFDFKEPSSLKVNYATTVRLPTSSKNVIFFEFINVPAAVSDKYKKEIKAVVNIGGITIFKGIFFLAETTEHYFEGVIISDEKDFLDLLDHPVSDLLFENNTDRIDYSMSAMKNHPGLLMAYARDITSSAPPANGFMTRYETVPAIRDQWIIEEALKKIGKTIVPKGSAADVFDKEYLLPISKLQGGGEYKDGEKATDMVRLTEDTKSYEITRADNTEEYIIMSEAAVGIGGLYYFDLSFRHQEDPTGNTISTRFDFKLFAGDVEIFHKPLQDTSQVYEYKVLAKIPPNTRIRARFEYFAQQLQSKLVSNFGYTVSGYRENQDIFFQAGDVPTLSQKKVFLDFIKRNYLYFTIKNNTIEIYRIADTLRGKFGQADWSRQLKSIDKTELWSGLKDEFTYEYSGDNPSLDYKEIINAQLRRGVSNIYKSVYNAPAANYYIFNQDGTRREDEPDENALLAVRGTARYEATDYIRAAEIAGANDDTDIRPGVIDNDYVITFTERLHMSEIAKNAEPYTKTIQSYKLITATFNLSLIDILNLDMKKLVMLDGKGRFYLMRVENYVYGYAVKAKLLRVI